ncbi:MAG: 4Fe-4S binding protein [Spirochaetales bacterium]|nr:4Fe-4S binding protein [Spirochaetales bacterium]
MASDLVPVIRVDSEKCVNCHQCISACPVKYCIDGSGEKVEINHNMCIGCGHCIEVCTHDARSYCDDSELFFHDLNNNVPMVAIAAPSIASSFPDHYLQLNDYFHGLGIKAVFDVSFGAELTVKSYLDHIKNNEVKTLIAQPCPAIVSFIQIYKPELLPYLAPAHSPMLHTIVMIRQFYSQYKGYKIAVLSPCLAKKREFNETGLGDYNLTFRSIEKHLKEKQIDLSLYSPRAYLTPAPERAVLFPSPGGLMKTAERDAPGLSEKTRKIEGPDNIYPYLSTLQGSMSKGCAPLLVDCLSCELGCNGGPGTLNQDANRDELEYYINRRRDEAAQNQKNHNPFLKEKVKGQFYKKVNTYWKPGLYNRSYKNLSQNNRIKTPNAGQLEKVYAALHKYSDKDIYNCSSCGYDSCEAMAIAIFNGLNKVENCYHYTEAVLRNHKSERGEIISKQEEAIKFSQEITNNVRFLTETTSSEVAGQLGKLENTLGILTSMFEGIKKVGSMSQGGLSELGQLKDLAQTGEIDMENTVGAISDIKKGVDDIIGAIEIIRQVAEDTRILSMNAEIEAAQAKESGKGFSVVAEEIRLLSDNTKSNALAIGANLQAIVESINRAESVALNTESAISSMIRSFERIANNMNIIYSDMVNMQSKSNEISSDLSGWKNFSNKIQGAYDTIYQAVKEMQDQMRQMTVVNKNLD